MLAAVSAYACDGGLVSRSELRWIELEAAGKVSGLEDVDGAVRRRPRSRIEFGDGARRLVLEDVEDEPCAERSRVPDEGRDRIEGSVKVAMALVGLSRTNANGSKCLFVRVEVEVEVEVMEVLMVMVMVMVMLKRSGKASLNQRWLLWWWWW